MVLEGPGHSKSVQRAAAPLLPNYSYTCWLLQPEKDSLPQIYLKNVSTGEDFVLSLSIVRCRGKRKKKIRGRSSLRVDYVLGVCVQTPRLNECNSGLL